MRHLTKKLRSTNLAPLVIAFCAAAGWAQQTGPTIPPAAPGTGTVIVGGADQGGFDPCLGENGANVVDEGTVTITINGTDIHTIQYGPNQIGQTTAGSVANALTNDINLHSPLVSATLVATSIGVITLTSRSPGSQTNYSVTTSTTYDQSTGCTDPNTGVFVPVFTSPSFTLVPSGPTLTGGADGGGTVNPRYVVLALGYAQPGSKSSVSYGSSTQAGTSTEIDGSYSNATSVAVTLAFGKTDNGFKIGTTNSLTQEKDTSDTITVNKSSAQNISIPGVETSGVAAPFDGINHDYDWVYLWLNPAIIVQQVAPNGLPNAVQWSGYTFDPNDDVSGTEVIGPIYMTWLKNPAMMPPGTADRLARAWAGPNQGLTTTDFNNILALDPFSAGSSNIDPARFTVVGGQPFSYEPPFQGGTPSSVTFPLTYTATSSEGLGSSTTRSVAFTLSTSATFFANFLNRSTLDTETLTWVDKAKSTTNATTTQSASMTLVGPSAGYQGPTEVQLYQDNIYGTFMFAFVQSPTFNLSASPSSQTVNETASTTYTISTSSVNGFTSGVTLGQVTGLPTGATATFSQTSLPGTPGTSVLTITTSNTPAGTYNLNVAASSAIDTRNIPITLIVNPPPDFTVSMSPSSEALLPGGCTSYNVSVAALFGFNGSVSLSQSALPAGVTGTFAPLSISGSGSSIYTVCANQTTPPGSDTITITGISGSLNHSTPVTLQVQGFTVSAAPASETIGAGTSAGFSVSSSSLNGFGGSINLSVTGGLPTGATASFTPNPLTVGGGSTLTVSTASSTPAGTYPLTIVGTSTGATHTTTASLVVSASAPPDGVTITSPVNNSTTSTSVRVTASASESTSQIGQMQIWDNGVRLGINNGATIDQTFTLSVGAHRITVEDLSAGTFTLLHSSVVNITAFADGVTITSPADGSTVTSPVHVAAFATESAAQVGQLQVWDNGVKLDNINASSVDRTYNLSSGAHRLTVEDLAAGTFLLLHKTIVNITVQ